MDRGVYAAVSGAVAQTQALDVLADNIANASTSGFRATRITFEEALSEAENNATPQVRIASIEPDGRNGGLRTTGNPLDVALDGEGAFVVQGTEGLLHTRNGSFKLDGEGRLVDIGGRTVLDESSGAITIPPGTKLVAIDEAGGVHADGTLLATLMIDGPPEGGARVVSGTLEEGNFNVVRGMVDLVRVSRTYEALARMIEGYKEVDTRTARELGSPK